MSNKKSVEAKKRSLQDTKNVFLFVPNLIGYTRIILASLSLYYMPWHPKVCVTLYGISCLLDAVDGNAARYFDQCSKFGAVLDMVTDSSHYMHMYSSMTAGSSSHKKISESESWYLRLYYNNNVVLFIMCAGNELFFVTLYVLKFFGPINATWCLVLAVSGIICFLKQFINVVQIVNASRMLASIDREERTKALIAKKS
ncbi:CDP-alcohol phosphatidyltransferase-domain-containing protein [Radiomyces spectabilis]|uniref:CDP-alcohol phosphatidyltransferase-domain-containing protein n=1 Tax=Radiomyces spectabilis TaxID=64574 RepID=UPI00221F7116|nr:CDP-alcohol phosphatidyltransferase-domain-containing protein [Radiomyces spectabilis]KAI8391008.1 CDP-alcohol phosphatidyltransferase-domain-containing protein [Radiomyces spectabilis]